MESKYVVCELQWRVFYKSKYNNTLYEGWMLRWRKEKRKEKRNRVYAYSQLMHKEPRNLWEKIMY